jgi:hypothetical protein
VFSSRRAYGLGLGLGLVATVLLVASVATLLVASHARPLDRGWWGVLLSLLGAGFVVGLIGWAGFRAVLLSRRSNSEPVGG